LDGSDEFTLGFSFVGLLFGPSGAVWASQGEAAEAEQEFFFFQNLISFIIFH